MSADTFSLVSSLLHWGVGALLAMAVLFFIVQFVGPGFRVAGQLAKAHQVIAGLKAQGPVLDLDRVATEAMPGAGLTHCWGEYRDTLHPQKKPDEFGSLQVVRWRATSLSQGFFTDTSLVDGPLRAEFYKHLPGMLTGLGIIGTFSGLILGLQGFQVTDDANQVRQSLATLIQSVGGAFLVSGAAILLAMLVTLFEKSLINRLYTATERLCGLIDSLFDAGAGEEYLQRLVEASETSATQAMQMKESLVTDLKQVLTELSHQQIATMTATSQQLGQSIAASLTEGLKEPLERISSAVQTVGSSQGEAVNKMLTDVLSGFSAQMEGMFGGQLRGMNDMLQQTARTIETASQRFDQLAGRIEQAGTGATDAMAKRMETLMAQMSGRQAESDAQMAAFVSRLQDDMSKGQSEAAELTLKLVQGLTGTTGELVQGLRQQADAAHQENAERQRAQAARTTALLGDIEKAGAGASDAMAHRMAQMTEQLRERQIQSDAQMAAFIERMQQTVNKGQSDSAELTLEMMKELSASTGDLVKGLQQQSHAAQQDHAARNADLAQRTDKLLTTHGEQVDDLVDAVDEAAKAMREAIDRLQATTQASADKMGQGADRLHLASTKLGDNLDTMRAVTDGLSGSAEKLLTSTGTVNTALAATERVLSDQRTVRDALATLVSDLKTTVENAKREAGFTKDLLDGLQVASQRLQEAQRAADTYLEGVTEVLGQAHTEFANQIQATLRSSNTAFHQELSQAVNYLKGAIQDLGDVLDTVPSPA